MPFRIEYVLLCINWQGSGVSLQKALSADRPSALSKKQEERKGAFNRNGTESLFSKSGIKAAMLQLSIAIRGYLSAESWDQVCKP